MPTALILIADGTEEIEFVTPYDVLTRAGVEISSAGVNLKNETFAVCSRNIRILPDHPSLSALHYATSFDILILPGGGPGAAAFCASETVLKLIEAYRAAGKYVGAICAGTTAVVKSFEVVGGWKGEGERKVRVTSHPSVEGEIREKGWEYSDERVVVDGSVITSRGPGTALLFALTIVELLCGKQKRDEVAGPMILPASL
ncbi:DJ-1 protein [Lepidopterella palustris CBS 459.81]|uniref:D-lactate dehydratase n=1 Tax=Lepidopterella palustris CBS 459.81 TaxID=1314670 RepID=A0A8E2EJ40_9PEZI|nr:DJ-1 protein [Lepidopterella palustris CBS 459.81]